MTRTSDGHWVPSTRYEAYECYENDSRYRPRKRVKDVELTRRYREQIEAMTRLGETLTTGEDTK